jgi:hypothetical protein
MTSTPAMRLAGVYSQWKFETRMACRSKFLSNELGKVRQLLVLLFILTGSPQGGREVPRPQLFLLAQRPGAYHFTPLLPFLKLFCRMVMPIKKFILSEAHISQPIPTLSDRQFIVTKSKLSKVQERAQRELFWYREELFKTLRGRWREVSLD